MNEEPIDELLERHRNVVPKYSKDRCQLILESHLSKITDALDLISDDSEGLVSIHEIKVEYTESGVALSYGWAYTPDLYKQADVVRSHQKEQENHD